MSHGARVVSAHPVYGNIHGKLVVKFPCTPSHVQNEQCVVIEARVLHEVEAAVETVNSFVKTAPTFIAKIQVSYFLPRHVTVSFSAQNLTGTSACIAPDLML